MELHRHCVHLQLTLDSGLLSRLQNFNKNLEWILWINMLHKRPPSHKLYATAIQHFDKTIAVYMFDVTKKVARKESAADFSWFYIVPLIMKQTQIYTHDHLHDLEVYVFHSASPKELYQSYK